MRPRPFFMCLSLIVRDGEPEQNLVAVRHCVGGGQIIQFDGLRVAVAPDDVCELRVTFHQFLIGAADGVLQNARRAGDDDGGLGDVGPGHVIDGLFLFPFADPDGVGRRLHGRVGNRRTVGKRSLISRHVEVGIIAAVTSPQT